MSKNIPTVLIAILIAVVGGFWWSVKQNGGLQESEQNGDDTVFCTRDAMTCPDGSYVSRTGPKCEFAACPEVVKEETIENNIESTGNNSTVICVSGSLDWKICRNEKYGFEFEYPAEWITLTCLDGIQTMLYSNKDKVERCDEPRWQDDISITGPGSPPGNITDAKRSEEITLNGERAIRYIDVPIGQDTSVPPFMFVDMIVVSNRFNETYTIAFEKHSVIANKIVTTFKFTK